MTAKFLTRSAIPRNYISRCKMTENGILTVKNLVLSHAIGVPVATKADNYQTLLFGHDSLVDMPAGDEMRENNRSHVVCFVRRYARKLVRWCWGELKFESCLAVVNRFWPRA